MHPSAQSIEAPHMDKIEPLSHKLAPRYDKLRLDAHAAVQKTS